LNDKKTLPTRKSTKKKKRTQVDDMKILPKIILISTGYFFFGEKESLLNKKSTNYKKTNSKPHPTTYGPASNTLFFIVWRNY
jgi:hypothetical protein